VLREQDVAVEKGADQFVLLSAICVQKPTLTFQAAKLKFEEALMASGLKYSIVRPTAFFKSLGGQVAPCKVRARAHSCSPLLCVARCPPRARLGYALLHSGRVSRWGVGRLYSRVLEQIGAPKGTVKKGRIRAVRRAARTGDGFHN